jgi:hypothetical protein
VSQRELLVGQRTAERFETVGPDARVTIAVGPWFREDVASGVNSGMRLQVLATGPAFNSSGTGVPYKVLQAGRVIGASIYSNSNVTAGSMIVGVYVNGSLVSGISDCQLNATNSRSAVYVLPWSAGVPFAAGETVEPRLMADAGFLPNGQADVTVTLYLAFEAV